jgi:hypothetical protein
MGELEEGTMEIKIFRAATKADHRLEFGRTCILYEKA